MPGLVSFNQCIARPDDSNNRYYLTNHLLDVAEKAKQRLSLSQKDQVLNKLIALAGVCHDIFKATSDWQKYINDNKAKKGPVHAPPGAFLFSFTGHKMLNNMGVWEEYKVFWLWLIRDIADHHGTLKNLDNDSWIIKPELKKIDISSVESFIRDNFQELEDIVINQDELNQWRKNILRDVIEDVLEELDQSFAEMELFELMKKLQCWRTLTVCLIAGDRFDVKEVYGLWFNADDYVRYNNMIDNFCYSSTDNDISKIRRRAQRETLKQLEMKPDERFYTLEMPTGYGKTITALKVATWLGINRGLKKIIYVAPYISILEQTSKVVEEVIKVIPLEHHSLAIPDAGISSYHKSIDNDDYQLHADKADNKGDENNNHLAMESWAHQIICTSFQQFSKAIFPGKAQEVLRRAFLHDSVVIIDEPQIFQPEGWNVFLCGLEALAEEYNLKVIFLSATMPTFEYGLTKIPARLSTGNETTMERYIIKNVKGKMNEEELAAYLLNCDGKKKAAILNTIEDAYKVYDEVISATNNDEKVCLIHGLMIPLHKKMVISKIQHWLKHDPDSLFYVVSTQVLEAGVDVSFNCIARALPIMPSIIQAAGRVNRHFENKDNEPGVLSVVDFYRGGEKNTRNSIYPKSLQVITDNLLKAKDSWYESETLFLIKNYYNEMFRHNTYEACKEGIISAYEGCWTELSEFTPFGADYFRLPLFVAWEPEGMDIRYIPENYGYLQQKINVKTPLDLYDLYQDKKYINSLTFTERKEFMVFFYYHVLNVPVRLALQLASKEDFVQNRVPILYCDDAYEQNTGLTRQFIKGNDNIL